jgi:hypothetical protein
LVGGECWQHAIYFGRIGVGDPLLHITGRYKYLMYVCVRVRVRVRYEYLMYVCVEEEEEEEEEENTDGC